MNLGVMAVRGLRAVQRHKGLAVAIFMPLATVATWGSLHLPGKFAATTQGMFLPQDLAERTPSLPFSPPSDEVYWNLSQQFGLYPAFFRNYAVYEMKSHTAVSLVEDAETGAKRLNVTFTDKSANTASAMSFALIKSVALAMSDAWQKKQQANAVASAPAPPQSAAIIQAPLVRTREEILLDDALRQDQELHAALQKEATEWSQMRRQLARLSIEERESMAPQLNKVRAEQEKQIVELQRQIVANHAEETKLKTEIAKQPREAPAPVPLPAPTAVNPAPGTKSFPWTVAISPNAEIRTVQRFWFRNLLLPAAALLTLLIVLLVDRFDGTLKTESDLQEQLIGSARYLGAVPRIKHETIYR